jgi:hypothetical protein
METTAEDTQQDLRASLSRLLNPDGSWNRSEIKELDASAWEAWMRLRLAGRDPRFGYGRDDHARNPGNLFRHLFETFDSIDTTHAARGLVQYLDGLDPSAEQGTRLLETIDLVLHVRPRHTPARDDLRNTLREWITQSLLLDRTDDTVAPATLHRKALFALAALQDPGGHSPTGEPNDERDIETFRDWLDDPDVAEAAFSGLCLALPSTPPSGTVHEFLELCDREGIRPQHPLETLVINRANRYEIRRYLWQEAHHSENPEARWNELQAWLGGEFYLPSYALMEKRGDDGFGTVGSGNGDEASLRSEGKGPPWRSSYEDVRELDPDLQPA